MATSPDNALLSALEKFNGIRDDLMGIGRDAVDWFLSKFKIQDTVTKAGNFNDELGRAAAYQAYMNGHKLNIPDVRFPIQKNQQAAGGLDMAFSGPQTGYPAPITLHGSVHITVTPHGTSAPGEAYIFFITVNADNPQGVRSWLDTGCDE